MYYCTGVVKFGVSALKVPFSNNKSFYFKLIIIHLILNQDIQLDLSDQNC